MTRDFEFPIWLPTLVREHARKFYDQALASGSSDELDMLHRITADPSMGAVWKYLQTKRRPKRSPYDYKHPVRDPAPDADYHPEQFPSRAEWMQQIGLAEIYKHSHQLGCLCLPSRMASKSQSPAILDELRGVPNVFDDQIAKLQADAHEWSDWIKPAKERGEKQFAAKLAKSISRLLALADDFDALKKIYEKPYECRVKPHEVLAAATALIAANMKRTFGEPMYGQTATIASLVLARPVTREQARGSYHGVWGLR
jgi:hypothetical protein